MTERLNNCPWFQASSGGLEHRPLDIQKTAVYNDDVLHISSQLRV